MNNSNPRSRIDQALVLLTGASILAGLYLAFLVAPPAQPGSGEIAQRIFYFHVPSAIMSFVAFLVCCIGSVGYLATRARKWDALALAGAEVGVLFAWLVLTTGPLWAKPAWGAYWVWDARLTTTLILFLIYVAYLLLRQMVTDPDRAKVLAAIVGIIGFVDVPIVYMANQWWSTTHPPPIIMERGALDPTMRSVLMFCMGAFVLLLATLVRLRYVLANQEEELLDLEACVNAGQSRT